MALYSSRAVACAHALSSVPSAAGEAPAGAIKPPAVNDAAG